MREGVHAVAANDGVAGGDRVRRAPVRHPWRLHRATRGRRDRPARPWRVRTSACCRARSASAPSSSAAPCRTMLVGSRAMTRWLTIAVCLWGAPLARHGAAGPCTPWPWSPRAVVGVGNAMVDVTAFTLIARMVPDHGAGAGVRTFSRASARWESGWARWPHPCWWRRSAPRGAGDRGRRWRPLLRASLVAARDPIDHSVAVRTEVIDLLRRVRHAAPAARERDRTAGPERRAIDVPAGAAVFEAGEVGDRFYVVEDGERRRSWTVRASCARWVRARASARSRSSVTPRAR